MININRVERFMIGRAGGDQLTVFLLFLSIGLTIMARIMGIGVLAILGYIPLGVGVYRIFSKDVNKRRMENYRFSTAISPLYARYKGMQARLSNRRKYKYFKCTNCKRRLRIPRGSGKVLVTCPNCKLKFIKKR